MHPAAPLETLDLMSIAAACPIFVVGASRSGTALMRSVLNRHPRVFLAGETHYFDDLRLKFEDAAGEVVDGEDRKRCEDYFLSLSHRPYSHGGDPERGSISREDLQAAIPSGREYPDTYFEAFCRILAEREEAEIWGEKTPRHIFRLDDILAKYPDARVIAMVRDPRAVVASYRDWRNQGGFDLEADPGHGEALVTEERRAKRSYNILIATMLWKSGVVASLAARNRHGNGRVHLVRYESLVDEPRKILEDVSQFVGLEFDPVILDVPVLNSSFSEYSERGGFQKAAATRWKSKLSPSEIAVIQRCAGNALTDAGYVPEQVGGAPLRYAWESMKLPFAAIRAAMANRDRIENLPQYVLRRVRLLGQGTSGQRVD